MSGKAKIGQHCGLGLWTSYSQRQSDKSMWFPPRPSPPTPPARVENGPNASSICVDLCVAYIRSTRCKSLRSRPLTVGPRLGGLVHKSSTHTHKEVSPLGRILAKGLRFSAMTAYQSLFWQALQTNVVFALSTVMSFSGAGTNYSLPRFVDIPGKGSGNNQLTRAT